MNYLQKDPVIYTLEEFKSLTNKTAYQLDSDWKDYNQLIKALQYGQKDIVRLLIQEGARVNRDPAIYFDYDEDKSIVFNVCTPLHLAVNLGCPEIIKMLLGKGASVTCKNGNQETPLVMAAKMGKGVIVDLLLSVVAQENHKEDYSNIDGISHMHIACMRNRVDIVKQFIQHGIPTTDAVSLDSFHWPGYTPLHFAVHFQCIETVDFLVNDCKVDFTIQARNQMSPLHLANALRNEAIIDIILLAHKRSMDNPVNLEGLLHFHIACTRNNPTIVDEFIQQGVSIDTEVPENSSNWPGYRPINFAIYYECSEVVKLLLLYNPNLDFTDKLILTPIQYAYRTSNKLIIDLLLSKINIKAVNVPNIKSTDFHIGGIQKNTNIIDKLTQYANSVGKPLDINMPIWKGYSSLHLAILQKCSKTAEILLENGASITVKDARGNTPLHLAFENKQDDTVDLILSKYINENENPVNDEGLSHFHICCTGKPEQLDVIKKFLQNDVNINSSVDSNSVEWHGFTALHFAIYFGHKNVVELLLNHGADVSAKTGSGSTPLDMAILNIWGYYCDNDNGCDQDALDTIDLILTAARLNKIDSFENHGFSRLHIFSANNDTQAIEQFLNLHPDEINQSATASMWSGYTPLHFAAHYDSKEAIELLLQKGADVSIKNADGLTPLHLLFSFRDDYAIEVPGLISSNENPVGTEGFSHFHIACRMGNEKAVEYFLKHGVGVNMLSKFTKLYDYLGQSPLHLAVLSKSKTVVHMLLKNGANIDARDAELNTPLHYTDCHQSINIMKELLSYGADVNALNMYKETPMSLACAATCSNTDIPGKIRLLLEFGADINIENERGEVPFAILYDRWFDTQSDMSGTKNTGFVVIMNHIKKLELINSSINDKNKHYYSKLLATYEANDFYNEASFVGKCLNELQRMVGTKLDRHTTLRDILRNDIGEIALYSENIAFQEIIGSVVSNEKFPIYGCLLELQFEKGSVRRRLLENAKASLTFMVTRTLPDTCSLKIFQYLSNEDLQNMISSRESVH